jgi:hypothetical protein
MSVNSCRVYLEEMFNPGPEPAVPPVDEHCQVLRHDGGLGAPLQLQHSHILIRVKPYVIFCLFVPVILLYFLLEFLQIIDDPKDICDL